MNNLNFTGASLPKASKAPSKSSKYLKIGKKLSTTISELDFPQKYDIRAALCDNEDFKKFAINTKTWTPQEHDNLLNILELPKNDNGYYKDVYGQRVSYNGMRTLKRAKTNLPLTDIHEAEIEKCKNSYKYFRKNYVKIVTRLGIDRPEPRPYQEKLEDKLVKVQDTVILYPRQSGKTVTVGTYLLWHALFHPDPINIGIVANKGSAAAEVLDKMKKIFVELPIWLQRGITLWNKGSIEFENGTRVMTDGPSSDSFRGYTINIVYCDEAAYIKRSLWDDFVDAVMPTMNSLIFKQVIVTSTAAGMNHFEAMCRNAKMPDTPEVFVTCSWKDVPRFSKTGKLLSPEEYKLLTIRKFGKRYFAQTESCEFLGSSETLISPEALREIENRLGDYGDEHVLSSNILDGLEVYKYVEPGHNYILSVDPSKDGIDEFSLNVIDISQFPFNQVASANLQIDYLVMPEHLDELGRYYNNAYIIIENNDGAGSSISDTLWSIYEYPNMYRDKKGQGQVGFKKFTGFRTTTKTRPVILNLLKIFIDDGKLIVNSRKTLQQFYTFTKRKTGNKFEAQDGYFDDAVMSLAVMFAPFMQNKQFDDYKMFIKELKLEKSELPILEFMSVLDVGFTTDDDEEENTIAAQFEASRQMLASSGQTDYAPAEEL